MRRVGILSGISKIKKNYVPFCMTMYVRSTYLSSILRLNSAHAQLTGKVRLYVGILHYTDSRKAVDLLMFKVW